MSQPDDARGDAGSEPAAFEAYLDAIQAELHELGVPGIFSAPAEVARLERLHAEGAPLDVVLRGVALGFERRVRRGREVRRLTDLMPTIRAELRRAGVVDRREGA